MPWFGEKRPEPGGQGQHHCGTAIAEHGWRRAAYAPSAFRVCVMMHIMPGPGRLVRASAPPYDDPGFAGFTTTDGARLE